MRQWGQAQVSWHIVLMALRPKKYVMRQLLTTHKRWMQEMCNEVIHSMPNPFHLIPDHFKTQGMRTKAIEVKPCQLYYFQLYTSLQYVPDYFVTQQLITK